MEEVIIAGIKYVPEKPETIEPHQNNLLSDCIGKYVIVRTYNEGINAGILVAADHTGCKLQDARRLYYHKPKNKKMSWYEGVALSGLSSDSKSSSPVTKTISEEKYSVIECSEKAQISITNHPTHEQS